jgi:hypothetical protein
MDNAILCLHDNSFRNILLGAYDEITPQLTDIFNRISKFGRPETYGEGGACFILSKERENSIAEIKYFASVPVGDMPNIVSDLSEKYSADYLFTHYRKKLPGDIPKIRYTDYFGDFPTSPACGLWFAVDCLNSGSPALPDARNILLVSANKSTAFITAVGKD